MNESEMDVAKLASGDISNISQSNNTDLKENNSQELLSATADTSDPNELMVGNQEKAVYKSAISAKSIDEKEIKLKERIAQCKNIIASLKLELNEEKVKIEKEVTEVQLQSDDTPPKLPSNTFAPEERTELIDLYNENMYTASVESKLNCDETLMEYEKQLQRYQNTLNMAQIEKRNAIRKQMLAKAFKLKLMEVENQCNIELLRIKQSLHCLEPLKMIVEKWKNSNDNAYDLDNFELIPRYPELSTNSGSDITSASGDDLGNKIPILNNIEKHE